MTRDELLKIHTMLCNKAQSLMRKKNADYAGNHGMEPFANFTRVETMGICPTEKGMLVRMTDKMSRLSSFMESGQFLVKDESLEDTLLDMINYSVLLYAYLQEKKQSDLKKTATVADIDSGRVFIQETIHESNQEGQHQSRSYCSSFDGWDTDVHTDTHDECKGRSRHLRSSCGNPSCGERRQ